MPRVRSGSDLAAVKVESKDIETKEEQFKKKIEPEKGFDLKQIGTHYESRRQLRREKLVLRYGELVPLTARSDKGWHSHVLAFARYSLIETAIIATNLNDNEVTFHFDLENLRPFFQSPRLKDNSVVMVTNWLDDSQPPDYFFLKEYLNSKRDIKLEPFHSVVLSLNVNQNDPFVYKKVLDKSIKRTKEKLAARESIESDQISLLVTDILQRTPSDVFKFADTVGTIHENLLKGQGLEFSDLCFGNTKLINDPTLTARLVALCTRITEASEFKPNNPPKIAAASFLKRSKMEPIVFATPELGRWSTVGGLGVMVDELAQGIAALGYEVWVVSPYYERNRKGETGYLAKDPAGFAHV